MIHRTKIWRTATGITIRLMLAFALAILPAAYSHAATNIGMDHNSQPVPVYGTQLTLVSGNEDDFVRQHDKLPSHDQSHQVHNMSSGVMVQFSLGRSVQMSADDQSSPQNEDDNGQCRSLFCGAAIIVDETITVHLHGAHIINDLKLKFAQSREYSAICRPPRI